MSITSNRAAEVLGMAVTFNGCGRCTSDELKEAVNAAQDALREKAEREDPKPLTLEDALKEPFCFVEYKEGSRLYWNADWAQVTRGVNPRRAAIWWFGNECEETPLYDDYGKTWICYRNTPKEVNNNAND